MPEINATFKVPAHIHRYLIVELGSPYVIKPDDSVLSRYMLRTLTGKTITHEHKAQESKAKLLPFQIIIPAGLNEKNWIWNINKETEKDFIFECEKIFETVFFAYVRGVLDLKPLYTKRKSNAKDPNLKLFQLQRAVENFCNRYNITENDISTDALVKRYQRSSGSTEFFSKDTCVVPTYVS